jgi:glycosyltransferase involved in cell wall biosynthesis
MMQERMSIVMATYNRASTLPRAIDSVVRQDHPLWELIIVDDGSTDDTKDVLRSYDDPKIIVVRHGREPRRDRCEEHRAGPHERRVVLVRRLRR